VFFVFVICLDYCSVSFLSLHILRHLETKAYLKYSDFLIKEDIIHIYAYHMQNVFSFVFFFFFGDIVIYGPMGKTEM